jgi:hypothetical protein
MDDFTDGIIVESKPGCPYSDVSNTPTESLMEL